MGFDINSFVSSTTDNLKATASQTIGTIGDSVNTLKDKASGALSSIEAEISGGLSGSFAKFGSLLRSKNILGAMDAGKRLEKINAEVRSTTQRDWRVRISFPPGNPAFASSDLLKPLVATNNSLIFPYTPTVSISHTANYNALAPVHSNYPFLSYENSKVDSITISGEFLVENSAEAAYWLGAVHFLRSITKMAYGDTSNSGSPPPVVRLNGYGNYVFSNIPVVVTQFNVELPPDVNYIPAKLMSEQDKMLAAQTADFGGAAPAGKVAYAPVKSTISVTCQVLYSREQVRQFSLDKFVKGQYVFDGNGFV